MQAQAKKPWYRLLYIQVLLAAFLGILVGHFFPAQGVSLKPLGDGFVNLVKMLIAPIVFCTVVHGIASLGDFKKLGRIGGKTLIYFEIVSTVALLIGLLVVNVVRPGEGLNKDMRMVDPNVTANFQKSAQSLNATEFILKIIPTSFFEPFVSGNLLQVLLIAVLTGVALANMNFTGKSLLGAIERGSKIFFAILHLVVQAAPIGAFGAMAFTVGNYGVQSLKGLAALMTCFYITAASFIIFVLGSIAYASGFSIFRFLNHIKDEIFLVLGTSSSETALPGMIEKMEKLGCGKSTVGLVIPTGYSFNLDGTNIYMSMAAVFLAQATNTPLGFQQQITLLLVAMLTSKGSSGVTGAGFITLAATLTAVPAIPIESLALLVGIDRFMSECRAITNLVGNGVATVVISRWEKEISKETLQTNLAGSGRLRA